MKILVTGGAGYIGSHTIVQLLAADYEVCVVDNLCNSSYEAVRRVKQLTNKEFEFYEGDVRDQQFLDNVLSTEKPSCVIHFAGLKAVGESVQRPLNYYDSNVCGTVSLCKSMARHGIKKLIFSSSATVYGEEAPVPYKESMPHGTATSPYGSSKAMIERILVDLVISDSEWSIAILRYFNPVGAHPSGNIGEDPKGIPNNLMPFISQVAAGRREKLSIFGNDYPTADGTCERDYLHVMDLADGHVAAIKKLTLPGTHIYNLGTGKGLSVLDMVTAFSEGTGIDIPYEFAPRRDGDLPAFWADSSLAKKDLDWEARRSLANMMIDTWRWQSQNPQGYD